MGSIVSHLLHFSENVFVCITCSSLVTCVVFTIIVTLLLGVGLGYNYCFIDFKSKHRHVPARYEYRYKYDYTPYWRSNEDYNDIDITAEASTISETSETNSKATTQYNTTDTIEIKHANETQTSELPSTETISSNINITEGTKEPETTNIRDVIALNNSKIIIPISGLDLISLLSKWRTENRNYTLHVLVS